MTEEEKMVEVLTAFHNGKKIQCKDVLDEDDTWEDCKNPKWNWYDYEYRIAPDQTKRYMTAEEVEEWFENTTYPMVYVEETEDNYPILGFLSLEYEPDGTTLRFFKVSDEYYESQEFLEHAHRLSRTGPKFEIELEDDIKDNIDEDKLFTKDNWNLVAIGEYGYFSNNLEDIIKCINKNALTPNWLAKLDGGEDKPFVDNYGGSYKYFYNIHIIENTDDWED